MKYTSLSELAIKLNINKTKLVFYYKIGLLKPVMNIGKTNVFDEAACLKVLKKIENQKNAGKRLKQIKL